MTEHFFIRGDPAPGGSKTAFVARRGDGSIVMRAGTNIPIINMSDAGGAANKNWRRTVTFTGRAFMQGRRPYVGAMHVEFTFYIRRPGVHFRTGKFSHLLRDDAPQYHIQAPDALKFARSTEDALTGVLWEDDKQTVRLVSHKVWCEGDEESGCEVRFSFLAPQTAPRVQPMQPTLL